MFLFPKFLFEKKNWNLNYVKGIYNYFQITLVDSYLIKIEKNYLSDTNNLFNLNLLFQTNKLNLWDKFIKKNNCFNFNSILHRFI